MCEGWKWASSLGNFFSSLLPHVEGLLQQSTVNLCLGASPFDLSAVVVRAGPAQAEGGLIKIANDGLPHIVWNREWKPVESVEYDNVFVNLFALDARILAYQKGWWYVRCFTNEKLVKKFWHFHWQDAIFLLEKINGYAAMNNHEYLILLVGKKTSQL